MSPKESVVLTFTISQSVQIERDPTNGVRGLNHLGKPYGPVPNILNAQELAVAYLHDVATIYGIDPALLNALAQSPSDVVEDGGTELRYSRQEAITGTATVSFQQTHFGLPVWQAGFTVSMLTGPLRATPSACGAGSRHRNSRSCSMPSAARKRSSSMASGHGSIATTPHSACR